MSLAINRTMQVLELVSKQPSLIRLTEIARRLEAPKGSLSPLLQTLVDKNYLIKDERKRYGIGPAFTQLSVSTLTPKSDGDLYVMRLLGLLIEGARSLFNAHGVCIFLWSEDDALLIPTYSFSLGVHESIGLRAGEGLAGRVWKQRKAILVPDYMKWEFALPGFRSSEWRSHMGTIISKGTEPVGVVVVRAHDDSLIFSEENLTRLENLSSNISTSLGNVEKEWRIIADTFMNTSK